MPKIVYEQLFDGAQTKIERLGLDVAILELRTILTDWELRVAEDKDANGGAALRRLIDQRFIEANVTKADVNDHWSQTVVGGIDWTRCVRAGSGSACLGVEVQVSGRSDLVAVDLLHISKSLRDGSIDVGVLVVPSDKLARYLPSRFPSVSESRRMLEMFDAHHIPLVFWGFEHDGAGAALPVRGRSGAKKRKRSK